MWFGLFRPASIRKGIDAYIVAEQYVDRLILLGGTLREDLPDGRVMVNLGANHASFVAKLSELTAKTIQDGIDALAPYVD
jgi:hypothetical protein